MASVIDLTHRTVLLVGDDEVAAELESSLAALGPDIEIASAALATEVIELVTPDLVVLGPSAISECGANVIAAAQAHGKSPVRVVLVCDTSTAKNLRGSNARGIANLDPALGASRVIEVIEQILRLDNDASGLKTMAELASAAHAKKSAARAPHKVDAQASSSSARAAVKPSAAQLGLGSRVRSSTVVGVPALIDAVSVGETATASSKTSLVLPTETRAKNIAPKSETIGRQKSPRSAVRKREVGSSAMRQDKQGQDRPKKRSLRVPEMAKSNPPQGARRSNPASARLTTPAPPSASAPAAGPPLEEEPTSTFQKLPFAGAPRRRVPPKHLAAPAPSGTGHASRANDALPEPALSAAEILSMKPEETTVVTDAVALNVKLEKVVAAARKAEEEDAVTQLARESANNLDFSDLTPAVLPPSEHEEEPTGHFQERGPFARPQPMPASAVSEEEPTGHFRDMGPFAHPPVVPASAVSEEEATSHFRDPNALSQLMASGRGLQESSALQLQGLAAAAASQAEPPLVRIDDLSSEFAVASAADTDAAPVEPSALVELSTLLASTPPPALGANESSWQGRVSDATELARSTAEVGIRHSMRAVDSAAHWIRHLTSPIAPLGRFKLRVLQGMKQISPWMRQLGQSLKSIADKLHITQWMERSAPWTKQLAARLQSLRIGKLRFPHLAAGAGAVMTLLIVLSMFVGGVEPAQTRALASVQIAGTLRSTAIQAEAAKNAVNSAAAIDDEDEALEDEAAADDEADSEVEDSSPDSVDRSRQARKLITVGNKKLRRKQLRFAEADFRKALKLVPRYPLALKGIARVHLARKDGKAAVRWAAMLVKRQPIRSENFLILGDAYALRGNKAAAVKAWKRAAKAGNKIAAKRLKTRK